MEDSFLLREVDQVRVKGREQPERIYELLGNSGDSLLKEMGEALNYFSAGLDAYRQQVWQEALDLFKRSLAILPEDGPSRIMVERCLIYQEVKEGVRFQVSGGSLLNPFSPFPLVLAFPANADPTRESNKKRIIAWMSP